MTRGEDGETVASGTIEVGYDIRAWLTDGEDRFDWITSDGRDSDELYPSIAEAVASVRERYGD
jgi:hypothetical protein